MARSAIFFILAVFLPLVLPCPALAVVTATQEELATTPLEDMVRLGWAASNEGNYDAVERIVAAARVRFGEEAQAQAKGLEALPGRDVVEKYKTMNDLGTLMFIRAEALMHQAKDADAVAAFEAAIRDFRYAQAWDASRGGFWSIAQKSKESLNAMRGIDEDDPASHVPSTKPVLATQGTDAVVDYAKYGTFTGIGTSEYSYKPHNPNKLAKAVGEGIYPNTGDVYRNPRFLPIHQEGRMKGAYWDFVNTRDLEAAYFKWAAAKEAPGVKLFYIGLLFEKAGMLLEALKAYHALVVHFPNAVGITYWQTPWYPGQAAISKIKNIIRQHPELGLEYRGGKIQILNSNDNSMDNDIFITSPGTIVKASRHRPAKRRLGRVKRVRGGKLVRLVQYASGDWKMFVRGKPYIIQGITYMPTMVGQTPDKGSVANWMTEDTNNNKIPDSPYEAWADVNRNNIQDPNEPSEGDFSLMKKMGVNTIRLYHQPHEPVKEVLRDLFKRYRIRVIMGDFFGKYTLGSGASWTQGTDYENKDHRASMLASVEKMVREFKDEPYILFWLLGNENNYGVASNADKKPDAFYQFANEVAKRIKEIDPTRPVAICNGDTLYLDKFAKNAPDIDIYGGNIYRGDYGFSSFWDDVRRVADIPAFITEYGAPAYSKQVTLEEAEEQQAAYHRGAWLDIMANTAGVAEGEGNAIGGVAFEWLDEWWKNYEPFRHDSRADVIGPFAGGYYFEEWFGLCGQGNGKSSPFLRQPRKSYEVYRKYWKKR